MKSFLVFTVLIAVLCAAGTARPEGMFNPPALSAPERADDKTVSFSLGYYFQKTKLIAHGETEEILLKPERQHIYAQFGYRFSEFAEGYLRVGAANFKFTEPSVEFKGAYGTLVSLGLNAIVYSSPNFSIGPTLQITYNSASSGEAKFISDNTSLSFKGGMRLWAVKGISDITAGIAAQVKLPYNFGVYGGPFAYWSRFEVTETENGVKSFEVKFREKNNAGGFAGIRYSPIRNLDVFFESVLKSRFGYGASVAYYF